MELESCANAQGVQLEEGCFDWGFCDTTAEGKENPRKISEDGESYWIPTIYTMDD